MNIFLAKKFEKKNYFITNSFFCKLKENYNLLNNHNKKKFIFNKNFVINKNKSESNLLKIKNNKKKISLSSQNLSGFFLKNEKLFEKKNFLQQTCENFNEKNSFFHNENSFQNYFKYFQLNKKINIRNLERKFNSNKNENINNNILINKKNIKYKLQKTKIKNCLLGINNNISKDKIIYNFTNLPSLYNIKKDNNYKSFNEFDIKIKKLSIIK